MNFDKLKNTLDLLIHEYNVPGLDCIVYKEHEKVFRYFAGMSDIENKIKIKGSELYIIFSMSKMLTCVSALQLLERGKFSLDDKISKYLPEYGNMKISNDVINVDSASNITRGICFGENVTNNDFARYAKEPITIKHLFTMTAGLDYDLTSDAILDAIKKGKKSTRELVSAFSNTVLGFEPGTRFRYSLCHDVLGALIEVCSDMKLGEYMKKNLFEPLGMKDTFFDVPKDKERFDRLIKRYIYDENKQPKLLANTCGYNLTDEYESGGAGIVSSADDYAVFLDALACGGVGKNGKRILNPQTIDLMSMNHLTDKALEDFEQSIKKGYGYGLGVRTHINPERSGSLSPIGEFGWDGAAGAFSMVDTKNKISLTYFQEIHDWDRKIQDLLRNSLYECL